MACRWSKPPDGIVCAESRREGEKKKKKNRERKKSTANIGAHTTGFDSGCCCREVAICSVNVIQYNTTLLSLCREISFVARHLHKNIQYS